MRHGRQGALGYGEVWQGRVRRGDTMVWQVRLDVVGHDLVGCVMEWLDKAGLSWFGAAWPGMV